MGERNCCACAHMKEELWRRVHFLFFTSRGQLALYRASYCRHRSSLCSCSRRLPMYGHAVARLHLEVRAYIQSFANRQGSKSASAASKLAGRRTTILFALGQALCTCTILPRVYMSTRVRWQDPLLKPSPQRSAACWYTRESSRDPQFNSAYYCACQRPAWLIIGVRKLSTCILVMHGECVRGFFCC